ncbi:MAG TPA: esterase-like activity of phytase family protein [Kofleriaceae bacterium]|nr:esterase-like activity of phytase family protein [Kofleriaceae bacterium]
MNARWLVVLALAGCHKKGDDKSTVAVPHAPFDEVDVDVPPGMSDLSLDDRGHLWAIAERERTVVDIELDTQHGTAKATRHPLDDVPDGVDTEALSWLGGGKFAVGTEGQAEATATVMFGELGSDGHIALHPGIHLTDAILGITLVKNHGVEALCGRGDDLLVAIESWGTFPDNSRWAPLVRIHAGALVGVQKLKLTSATGKISAMTCTFAPDGTVDAIAIERHYSVSRILTFSVPLGKDTITPEVALDLWPIVRDRYHAKLNLEGIVKLADGRWVMINDNQGARVDGPTKLFVFHPR